MSVSRQLRSEAMPEFFKVNKFEGSIRSNRDVWGETYHGPEHQRYEEAGLVGFSPLLSETRISIRDGSMLQEKAVRFSFVILHIKCGCERCDEGSEIGRLVLENKNGKPISACLSTAAWGHKISRPALNVMYKQVAKLLARIGNRCEFKGFTVQDIKDAAASFRRKPRPWNRRKPLAHV